MKLRKILCFAVTIILQDLTFAEDTDGQNVVKCLKNDLTIYGEKVEKGQDVIVKEGQNVTLSLCTGGKSDDCDIDLNDQPICEVEENSTKIDCDDEKMKDVLSGENSAEFCKVTIKNVTQEMEANFKLKVKFSQNEINLKLHKKFDDDIKVTLGDESEKVTKENIKSSVHCAVKGGFPTPKVIFMLMKDNNTVVNDSESRFDTITNSSKDDIITFTSSFTPSKDDQGLFVCCHAEQFDNIINSSLYKKNEMMPLDVLFAPQKVSDVAVDYKTAAIMIESNPAPSSVNLKITCEDDKKCPLSLSLKEGQTDYSTASANLTMRTDGDHKNKYKIIFSITSTEPWVHTAMASINITNSVGSISEDKIQMNKKIETTTTPSGNEGTDKPDNETNSNNTTDSGSTENGGSTEGRVGNPGITALVVIVVIIVAIGGIFYYRRWKSRQNERIPLTNGPSMSSLQ